MSSELNVCGVLVHAHPAKLDAVEAGCAAITGVEVHGRAPQGRLILTVEDTAETRAADTLADLNKVPGVIAAALVYHEIDAGPSAPAQAMENAR